MAERVCAIDQKSCDAGSAGPRPMTRHMSVIAQDPSVRRPDGSILMAMASVPAEELIPGPIGYRVQVVDFDSSTGEYHGAHALPLEYDREPPEWRAGAESLLSDNEFHAQNAYALIMGTLARFEYALGRRIGWSFGVHQLKVAPHGMMNANAFYSRRDEGLVLGYFEGRNRKKIYTCLSHDIVVHETSHALIDALRERYLDPSGPDQAALHEGFADIIALLSVFAQTELIEDLLCRGLRRKVSREFVSHQELTPEALRRSALFALAKQMGKELQTTRGDALRRSAELIAAPELLKDLEFQEPHRRGEILVAAVMNSFIDTWSVRVCTPRRRRYAVRQVAEEGAEIAATLVTMWIRALDYMPPVHVVFGDALSAALTADLEVRPDDHRLGLRASTLSSFARFGIEPTSPRQDPRGVWLCAPAGLKHDRVRFDSMRSDKDEVFRFIWENRDKLKVHKGVYTEVLSVRPCTRIGEDGFVLHETVAEYYQVARLTPEELRANGIRLPKAYVTTLRHELRMAAQRRHRQLMKGGEGDATGRAVDDDTDPVTPVYGGGVLVFDEYGKLKYHVHNDIFGSRQTARLDYLWKAGLLRIGGRGAPLGTARLSSMHYQRAVGARRFPEQGW